MFVRVKRGLASAVAACPAHRWGAPVDVASIDFFSLFRLDPVSDCCSPVVTVGLRAGTQGCFRGRKQPLKSALRLSANAFVPCNLCAFFRSISAAEPSGHACGEDSVWGKISLTLRCVLDLRGLPGNLFASSFKELVIFYVEM